MREEILLNIDNPTQLEKLYRANKPIFKSAFNAIYAELPANALAEGWFQRLNYMDDETRWGSTRERTVIVGASLLAAFLVKVPAIFSIDETYYYSRNISFIVLPILIAYFVWKNRMSGKIAICLGSIVTVAIAFINFLPKTDHSDTLILSCIHLPLLMWSVLGFVYGHDRARNHTNWLVFLKYNGSMAVMTAILLISGGLITGMTLGLFTLLGVNITDFYFSNVVLMGLAVLPIVGTFIIQEQPTMVNHISPFVAKLFSPAALAILLVYLGAMVFSGKDPYHDREFLLIFNALLVGVMALIFFSVADADRSSGGYFQVLILFLLATVTIVVNGIVLTAILFRIFEWGITANRLAVLGGNVLMFTHLLFTATRLWKVMLERTSLSSLGDSMAIFLPVYAAWAGIVTFLFPLIFSFK